MNDVMQQSSWLVSKVLILDDVESDFAALRTLCESNNLVGIRPPKANLAAVMQLLKTNIDLGGILLYAGYGGSAASALALARAIRKSRPELPLFLRSHDLLIANPLDEQDAAMFRCVYTLENDCEFRATLDASIFSRVYPNDMVRAVAEMSQLALQTLFIDCDIDVETPYLVKDQIIYGEVSTLIGIETHWCRGYMMLQTAESELLDLLHRSGALAESDMHFRELNSMLGEATNLIWGAFRNRFTQPEHDQRAILQTQVPIVINHQSRYISFGSQDPQLCLKFNLRSRKAPHGKPVTILQRFVFNLSWTPEAFASQPTIDSFVDSGELELF